MTDNKLTIRPARADDADLILAFIHELAEYEKLSHEVQATPEMIRATLFTDPPPAEALLGFHDDEPAVIALFFTSYSTFLAKPGIYLEDLFVRRQFRGLGLGKAMLSKVAEVAVSRGCGRLEWSVLDWNDPAIGFYRRLGAGPMDEWTMWRITGDSLRELASNPG
jgi:GNAT superfamily N-acetyltransferase